MTRAVISDDEPLMRSELRARLSELWPDFDGRVLNVHYDDTSPGARGTTGDDNAYISRLALNM